MNYVEPSSSLTDEEIEAFLATRPPWRNNNEEFDDGLEEGGLEENEDMDLTEFLNNESWNVNTQTDSVPASIPTSTTISSAFAAQFVSGTPEQGMLLQALAEQQEENERVQRQSTQLTNNQNTPSSNMIPLMHSNNQMHVQHSPSIDAISSQLSSQQFDPRQAGRSNTTFMPFGVQPFSSPSIRQGQRISNLNEEMMQHRQSASIGSPQSEIFSSPEEQRRQLAAAAYSTPSRASHSSLQSVQEHDIPTTYSNRSTLSSPSERLLPTRRSTISDYNKKDGVSRQDHQSDPMHGFVRRGSAEMASLRQRRQVRRTYTGPSIGSESELHSPITSFIDATGNLRLVNDGNGRLTAATTTAFAVDQSPLVDNSTASTLSPSDYRQRISEMSPTSIPTSLSAELAGLGLDVNKFYKENDRRMDDHDGSFMDGEMAELNEEDEGSENDISMQRTSSSSSATTTKVRSDIGDQSLFSHNTTFSSGLDDSVFSENSSRWVHGRDTPPSTPPKNIILRPSSAVSEAAGDVQMNNNSTQFLKPTVPRYPGSETFGGSVGSAKTWPRRLSNSSSPANSVVGIHPSHLLMGPSEGSRMTVHHSPIQHSLSSDHAGLHATARISPQSRLVRTPSSSSSSIHTRGESMSAASTIAAASAASGSSGKRRSRPSSRIFTSLEAANLSVESLRSETYSTSRSSRLRGGSGGSTNNIDGGMGKVVERNKRWSTSFINNPPSFDSTLFSTGNSSSRGRRIGSGGAAAGRMSEPDQYEQVSAALETLRTFLRQRGGNGGNKQPQQQQGGIVSTRSISSQLSHMSTTSTATSTSSMTVGSDDLSSHAHQQKMLRHPPPGPLPPRGSFHHQGKDAAMRTPNRPSSSASSHSISPITSFNLSPQGTMRTTVSNPINYTSSSLQRTSSMSTSSFDSMPPQRQRQQSHHQHSTSSTSIDKVAVLEDLADRIRRMRDDDQFMQHQFQD